MAEVSDPATPVEIVKLRPPTFSTARSSPAYQNPSLEFLERTWHVTHSTLPMWKSKRNVQIKYTRLPPSSPDRTSAVTDRLDDTVTYQPLHKDQLQTVHGIDKAAGNGLGEWDWRGCGWLKIASSHWEILGWGEEASGLKWAVTMFAKTLFTPAGIDVYADDQRGVQMQTLDAIKAALILIEDEGVRKLAGDIFEITRN